MSEQASVPHGTEEKKYEEQSPTEGLPLIQKYAKLDRPTTPADASRCLKPVARSGRNGGPYCEGFPVHDWRMCREDQVPDLRLRVNAAAEAEVNAVDTRATATRGLQQVRRRYFRDSAAPGFRPQARLPTAVSPSRHHRHRRGI